ncbi:unnamed protein product [Leuciscus chuanchicus]
MSLYAERKEEDPFAQSLNQGVASPEPSCVSMKSDASIKLPPFLSDGPVTTGPSVEKDMDSKCGVCKQVLKDPVSMSCGHSFCRNCINRRWDLFSPSEYFDCPRCRKRSRNRPSLKNVTGGSTSAGSSCYTEAELLEETSDLQQDSQQPIDDEMQRVKTQHKTKMKNSYVRLFEGIKQQGNETLLNRIYTQLYIIKGESEGVNEEHEVLQMEITSTQDTPINCNDIFKASPEPGYEEKDKIKAVLTKGIAGIGKTVSVQKFILDWAEGNANQDVDFMFVLPFRELNLIQDDQYSLHKLLLDFHPELQDLDSMIYKECKVLFIFDGLDESRIKLRFSDAQKVSDVTETSSVGVLMSNLMKGDLLPSALIWITSRPAAANQIPSEYINRVTDIQGFNDPQKEEYFRKRISDEHQASKIISHIRSARSLHIMCHIPVFCWISSTVLQKHLKEDLSAEIPKTLTEMYIHFLLIQINMRNQKYEERDPEKLLQSCREGIVKLAELAFKQLMNGNVMFYEEDLIESGIDVTDTSVYSGICTEIFKEESVIHQRKVYSFLHLSFQEFLAAFFMFVSYLNNNSEVLRLFLRGKSKTQHENLHLDVLLKGVINKALDSKNGHLDLFLRFLLGISLESNQRLLQDLLTHKENSSESIEKGIQHIKRVQKKKVSPERWMNLSHCLIEMKDNSLFEEMKTFLSSETSKKLSLAQCSTLANMILMSAEVMDVLDLGKYNIRSRDGQLRLVPAVRNCRKALLASCNLTDQCCDIVASALQSSNSCLRELDLSNNDLCDSGVKLLCAGLKSPNCKLEILRLSGCMLTEESCCYLASALSPNPSHLRELDLSYNHLGQSGVKKLSDTLNNPNCALEILNIDHGGEIRITSGPKKYACDLTLDPNTAHAYLALSEQNRKVTYMREEQPYPYHPERFEKVPQVLCRESLSGRCYWEAEWSGDAEISVTYKGIGRKGGSDDCAFGSSEISWSLICSDNKFTVCHNNKSTKKRVPSGSSKRVGVYVDMPAGTLSFYSAAFTLGSFAAVRARVRLFPVPPQLWSGFTLDSIERILCSFMPLYDPHETLEHYIDLALLLSGSSFTVGGVEEELREPAVSPQPELLHVSPAEPALHVSPAEPELHVSPAEPELHVSPAEPETVHVTSAEPETVHVTSADPEAVHVTSADPEAVHVTSVDPEAVHVTSADPETVHVRSAEPVSPDKMAAAEPVSQDKMVSAEPVSPDKMVAAEPVSQDKMVAAQPVSPDEMAAATSPEPSAEMATDTPEPEPSAEIAAATVSVPVPVPEPVSVPVPEPVSVPVPEPVSVPVPEPLSVPEPVSVPPPWPPEGSSPPWPPEPSAPPWPPEGSSPPWPPEGSSPPWPPEGSSPPPGRLHCLLRPGRLHCLLRPGRLHCLLRPGRLHCLLRPGRLHCLLRPGRLHCLLRPGRLHCLLRPGRLHCLLRPGRLHCLLRPGRLIRPGRLHSLIRPGLPSCRILQVLFHFTGLALHPAPGSSSAPPPS